MEKCKQYRLPLETIKSQTDLSTINDSCSHRQPLKRFSRCTSNSRSRSKEDSKEKLSNHFFVKNICTSVMKEKSNTSKDIQLSQKVPDLKLQSNPRQSIATKKKRLLANSPKQKQNNESGICKELAYLNMQRKYFANQTLRSQLVAVNRELQQKIVLLQGRVQEQSKQNCFLLEKIRYYEQRENARLGIKSPRTNAQKLKKQIIAEHRNIDAGISLQGLRNQMIGLKTQNSELKDALQESDKKIKDLEKITKTMVNQQEDFMKQLASKLKAEINSKDELIRRMQIQLNIFQAKQSRRSNRQQLLKNQELAHLKKKYTHVLVKCHQISQQLAVHKRKEENSHMISQVQKSHHSISSSLSLSP